MTAQTLITSTTGVIAISTAAGGNNRLKPSTYTPLVPKTAILRVTTRCSQILRPSTVWGGQLYPLKTRILVAAGFVETKKVTKINQIFRSQNHMINISSVLCSSKPKAGMFGRWSSPLEMMIIRLQ